MSKVRVIPVAPKSVIKRFRLCPTVVSEEFVDSTFDYYHRNFGITKMDFIPVN